MGRNHFTEEPFAVAEVVEAIATEKGYTPGQLARAWCKEQPSITSPIIGPRTMEQLEDNLGATNVRSPKRIVNGSMRWPLQSELP
jgi:aryl-alcohol dehydrogenase-like predicted oxidoreductase